MKCKSEVIKKKRHSIINNAFFKINILIYTYNKNRLDRLIRLSSSLYLTIFKKKIEN